MAANRRYLPLQPCGTRAAYQRHIAHREVPCEACTQANREQPRLTQAQKDQRLAPFRRAVLAAAIYTGKPRRGMQGARQRAILRGEIMFDKLIVALIPGLLAVDWWRARRRP